MISKTRILSFAVPLKKIVCLIVGSVLVLASVAFAWEKDKPAVPPVVPPNPNNLPKVLLIGDSISGGYYKLVAKALEGKAIVAKSSDNGESTAVGVIKIDGWLSDIQWDVIHFNWGVWDMYGWQYAADDRAPAAYAKRLETLVQRMKKTGAKLIWATTTPVPPGAEKTMLTRFKTKVVIDPDLERQYQDAALQVMKKHDVQVNDLYALIKPHRSEFQKDDDVHFSGEGYGLMAKQVADSILQNLGRATEKRDPEPKPELAAPTAEKSVKELQEDFLKLKFGMFLHYNMATYTGEQWVKGYPDPSTFNPEGLVDTDAWANAAKAAGMTYGILTVKHVAGFCLWDSKYTTYDVMNPKCPYQQDLVAQFIKSFKSRGLKVGLYYHWRHPGFGDPNKHKVLAPECDPATHSQEEQKEFQLKQIAELLEKYPDCFYFWNDAYDPQIGTAEEVLKMERSIRPNILASSNWWNWGKKGTPYLDIAVKELSHFPENNQAPGETCFSMAGRKWFWDSSIRGYDSAQDIVDKLRTANARHSNLLLNVPPNKQGKLDDAAVKVLTEVGKLLNADAVAK